MSSEADKELVFGGGFEALIDRGCLMFELWVSWWPTLAGCKVFAMGVLTTGWGVVSVGLGTTAGARTVSLSVGVAVNGGKLTTGDVTIWGVG